MILTHSKQLWTEHNAKSIYFSKQHHLPVNTDYADMMAADFETVTQREPDKRGKFRKPSPKMKILKEMIARKDVGPILDRK